MSDISYTPAQQAIVDDLFGQGQPRPTFERSLANDLRRAIEADLADAPLPEAADPLWIGKRALTSVHTCEARYLAEQQSATFEWTVPLAEGELAHRSIERMISVRGDVGPPELVDRTLDRMREDDSDLGRFVASLDPLDAADLRSLATRRVTAFTECWPPMRSAWRPRMETTIKAELCGGRLVVSGRPDLALGVARGMEARVLIVDVKTGRRYHQQLDDLRFYALVQTLRIGVPPFRVATYYLATATFWAEDVTVDTLDLARRRLVDGARTMAEVRGGRRGAEIRPGPGCRWCSIRDTCAGPKMLADPDDQDAVGWEGYDRR